MQRRRAAKEIEWASVHDTVATVKRLVADHLETARIMTAPVRINRDLASTAVLLRQFVDAGSLPLAYDEVHGVLEQLIQSGKFSAEANALMRRLRISLSSFQVVAFMYPYNSWAMTDAVESVSKLVTLLESPDASSGKSLVEIGELRRLLVTTPWKVHPDKSAWQLLRELPGQGSAPADIVVEPMAADEMISIVRDWLKDWFEQVQRTLYGTTGIYRLVGKLETMG